MIEDSSWFEWSSAVLENAANEGALVINPLIFAEVSVGFQHIDDVEAAFPDALFVRSPLPWAAGFLAGKCFQKYRARGGATTSPLPDFYIGAHAAVSKMRLLTRDAARYRTYFPTVALTCP